MVSGIEGAVITGDPEVEIAQIEYDSRMIKQDALFFAIRGFKRDGYDFVTQARNAGAIAVMGERAECGEIPNHVQVPNGRSAMATAAANFYGRPGEKLKACGVTGTNGKTTTCFMIRDILEARNKTAGLITSVLYDTGKQVFKADRTTPESLDVQRLLYLMKVNYCVNAVIEVSSHALALNRVDHINFRVAVYTNITRDHLDFHKDMDDYLATKMKLAKNLEGELSYAVINLDVEEFRPLFGEITCSHISYSMSDPKADVRCESYELTADGTTFDLATPMGKRTIHLSLPGRFNLQNAVAASAGGLACGVDVDTVVTGLEHARVVPGRLRPLRYGQPFAVYIDFAHTPDALERLIETARELTEGKLLVLFGCGGDRDRGKRPLMGKAATEKSDFAVVTSDNPRTEDPLKIIDDIKPGLVGSDWKIIPDRAEAIEAILRKAQAGDTVLLAGKGAEDYQEINGEKQPFREPDIVQKVLRELGYSSVSEDSAEGSFGVNQ